MLRPRSPGLRILGRIFALAALSSLALSPLCPSAHAEGGTWPPIGQWAGGTPRGVAVEDGYAYVAAGSAMTVIDTSSPFEPRMVGYWDTLRLSRSFGIRVEGGRSLGLRPSPGRRGGKPVAAEPRTAIKATRRSPHAVADGAIFRTEACLKAGRPDRSGPDRGTPTIRPTSMR